HQGGGSMPRFDPFGMYGDEPEPSQEVVPPRGFPPPEMIKHFMKATGIIPEAANVEIVAIGVEITRGDGSHIEPAEMPSMAWKPGDPLPHTSRTFSDPPVMMTPDEWKK